MAAVELGAHELGDLDVVDDDPAHPLVAVDDHLVDHGGDDAQPPDVGVADRGPREVDLAEGGAGQVDPPEGGLAEGIGVVVVDRHPGIVAEPADGRCV